VVQLLHDIIKVKIKISKLSRYGILDSGPILPMEFPIVRNFGYEIQRYLLGAKNASSKLNIGGRSQINSPLGQNAVYVIEVPGAGPLKPNMPVFGHLLAEGPQFL